MNSRAVDEIDIAGCAAIAYSSENPAHPVEHLLDGRSDAAKRGGAAIRVFLIWRPRLAIAVVRKAEKSDFGPKLTGNPGVWRPGPYGED